MPNSLSNLEITSVDLVEAGANQEANIEIIKRKDSTMSDNLDVQEVASILTKSIMEICNSPELSDSQKDELTQKSFIQSVIDLNKKLSLEKTEEPEVEETPEVIEAVEPETETEEVTEVVSEETAENEDVEKARQQADEIIKGFKAQIDSIQKKNDELTKRLELKELEKEAQIYQPLGEDPAQLAKKLYSFKQSGQELYDEYIAVLNKSLKIQEETGIFKEYGSSQSYENSSNFENILKSYTDRGEDPFAAFEKIAIDHPELLAEYDRNYRG